MLDELKLLKLGLFKKKTLQNLIYLIILSVWFKVHANSFQAIFPTWELKDGIGVHLHLLFWLLC